LHCAGMGARLKARGESAARKSSSRLRPPPTQERCGLQPLPPSPPQGHRLLPWAGAQGWVGWACAAVGVEAVACLPRSPAHESMGGGGACTSLGHKSTCSGPAPELPVPRCGRQGVLGAAPVHAACRVMAP